MFPFEGSPICIARGFAAICCSENPSPTINNPEMSNSNEALFDAGMNKSVPDAEISKPKASPLR
jgi:hypothetical protein